MALSTVTGFRISKINGATNMNEVQNMTPTRIAITISEL